MRFSKRGTRPSFPCFYISENNTHYKDNIEFSDIEEPSEVQGNESGLALLGTLEIRSLKVRHSLNTYRKRRRISLTVIKQRHKVTIHTKFKSKSIMGEVLSLLRNHLFPSHTTLSSIFKF